MKTPNLDKLIADEHMEIHNGDLRLVFPLATKLRAAVAEDMKALLAIVARQHREMSKLAAHSLKMDNSHAVKAQAWADAAEWVEKFARKATP